MSELSFTHIHEGSRAALNLTRDEYALCNYIHTWAGYPGRYPGFCDRSQNQMAAFVGITDRGVRKMLQRLESDGLVEINPINGKYRTTKKWFEMVVLENQNAEQSSYEMRNKVPKNAEQSSSHKKSNTVKKEKDIYITPKKIETIDEAETLIKAWLNSGNLDTVKSWYDQSMKHYDRSEFLIQLTKFCSNYLNTSDKGRHFNFVTDPVKFFINGFRSWILTTDSFTRNQTTTTQPKQEVYKPLSNVIG